VVSINAQLNQQRKLDSLRYWRSAIFVKQYRFKHMPVIEPDRLKAELQAKAINT
jgi:hypothetical protein